MKDGSTSSPNRHNGTDNGLVDVDGQGDTVPAEGIDDGREYITLASTDGSNGALAGMMDRSTTSPNDLNKTDNGLVDVDDMGSDVAKEGNVDGNEIGTPASTPGSKGTLAGTMNGSMFSCTDCDVIDDSLDL